MHTFFHAFPKPRNTTSKRPAFFWWAVHAETITPIRIRTGHANVVTLEFYPDATQPVHVSHPEVIFNMEKIGAALFDELKAKMNPHLTALRSSSCTTRPDHLPDHLIVSDITGNSPHLWRTLDPCVIYPVENKLICFANTSILGLPAFIRSHVDLPVSGWQYYWDECQNALEDLTPAFLT